MASLRKLPTSKFWIACYTDHTGKQRQRSTKEINRAKAQRIAETYEEAYRKMRTESQARDVLSDIYEEVHGNTLSSSTIHGFLNQWILRKHIEVRPSTYQKYKGVIEQFIAFQGTKATRDLAFLDTSDIAAFRDHLAQRLSTSTVNTHIKILKRAFGDAWKDNLIRENPAAKVSSIRSRGDEIKRRAFTLKELKDILAVANQEWKGMILAAIYTGQRLGDIAGITWNQINIERQEIKFITTKTGKHLNLPIAKALLDYIVELPSTDKEDAPLFPNAHAIKTKNTTVSSLSDQFHRILVSAGLAEARTHQSTGKGRGAKRSTANNLSFHCLRHTATSLLKNAGVSEAVAMDIIGHNTKAISSIYTHIEDKAKQDAINRLPDLK